MSYYADDREYVDLESCNTYEAKGYQYYGAGYVSYIINTRAIHSGKHLEDGVIIRRCATENNVTIFTSLDTVRVLLDVLEETTITVSTIDSGR